MVSRYLSGSSCGKVNVFQGKWREIESQLRYFMVVGDDAQRRERFGRATISFSKNRMTLRVTLAPTNEVVFYGGRALVQENCSIARAGVSFLWLAHVAVLLEKRVGIEFGVNSVQKTRESGSTNCSIMRAGISSVRSCSCTACETISI